MTKNPHFLQLEEDLKEFENTKFARYGGSSFECSDYEGMYANLWSFLIERRILDWKKQIERLINWRERNLEILNANGWRFGVEDAIDSEISLLQEAIKLAKKI